MRPGVGEGDGVAVGAGDGVGAAVVLTVGVGATAAGFPHAMRKTSAASTARVTPTGSHVKEPHGHRMAGTPPLSQLHRTAPRPPAHIDPPPPDPGPVPN